MLAQIMKTTFIFAIIVLSALLSKATAANNLLENFGFEDGLNSWISTGNAAIRTSDPFPYEGVNYLFGLNTALFSVSQDVNLRAKGLLPCIIDTEDLVAVYGGFQAGWHDQTDRGTISITFLNENLNSIGGDSLPSFFSNQTWVEQSGAASIPAGTRWIRYHFLGERRNGYNSDAFLDAAYINVVPEPLPFHPEVKFSVTPLGREITLSWPERRCYTFALQESRNLLPWEWSFAASGRTNPVTIFLDTPIRFFRLQEVDPIEIAEQPQSQSVQPGNSVSLRVIAVGVGSLRYQWSHNGHPIGEATNSSLHITDAQLVHHGEYQVTVMDDLGSVTSDVAWLWLTMPGTAPTIILHPRSQTVRVGEQVKFSVMITNTAALPIGYLWRKGFAIVDRQGLHEHYSTFTITNVQPSDAGGYRVSVTNSVSSVPPGILSDSATLTVLEE
jgi:hypothetical protein